MGSGRGGSLLAAGAFRTRRTVRIVDGTAVLAEHARCYSAGETTEAAAHVEALVAEKAAARAHHDLGRLQHQVPAARELLRVLAERGEPLARAVRQLDVS